MLSGWTECRCTSHWPDSVVRAAGSRETFAFFDSAIMLRHQHRIAIASPSLSAYAARVASMGRVGAPSHADDNKTPRYLKGKLAAGAGNGSPELQAG